MIKKIKGVFMIKKIKGVFMIKKMFKLTSEGSDACSQNSTF